MSRRGRILQVLSKVNLPREEDKEDEDEQQQQQQQALRPSQLAASADEPKREESTASSRPYRGRGGRVLAQMAAIASRRAEVVEQESDDENEDDDDDEPTGGDEENPSLHSSDSTPSKLVRQDSDVSRSSILSQQFAQIEKVDYKAKIAKGPTTAGTANKLSVNYMTFNVHEGKSIEEYHVDFRPNIESIRLRYTILRSEPARAIIGPVMHWTGTNLYLPIKLAQSVTEFQAAHPASEEPIRVKLTFVKTPPDSELLPFYNSLMHKVMNRLRYVIINRKHYSPIHKIPIEQYKLEVWPGWLTSIQRLDGGLKLSIDASFRVLRLETVRDIMKAIRERTRGGGMKEAFESELVGTIIMTRYNNRAYRIDGIDFTKNPTHSFVMDRDGGKEITYADYMKHHYNITVNDLQQPLIVYCPKPKRGEVTGSETLYLIPELCVTTGLTDEMRANFNIMKSIDEHTKLAPNIREGKLVEFLQQISTDERATSVFSDWNLSVRPQLDIVPGRRLDTETIVFGNNRLAKVPENADWTRAATSGPMLKTVSIDHWVIMYTERDTGTANEFMDIMKDVSRSLGVNFKAPRTCALPNDQARTYVEYGKNHVQRSDQLVVILTPGKSQREDRYSACKRLYSCDLPVPCQFIRCGTIGNPRRVRSICQKIVIQILCKVGGQPWGMSFPMKSFMVVGIDVYHDTLDRKKSCVAVVASMNGSTSAWWSQTFFQHSLEEVSVKLSQVIVSALRKYHALNGFVPQKVIVYRDGVGDGQLETVLQLEVTQAVNAIRYYMRDSHQIETEAQVSYVIVQKRINAKLSLRQGGSVLNPPPGTFLDHTITHPEYNDFYLVSQHVNQGTVNPTKYIVLTETGTLKLEHHQKMAYKMTHMYYNWCGTIRVPAPCQYAHKLAYLSGQNIKQTFNEKLEDKLFFL